MDILFCSLLLLLSIQAVNRAYEYKNRYMGKKELLMLIVPSLLGMVGYMIFHFYQVKSEMTGFYDVLCFPILFNVHNSNPCDNCILSETGKAYRKNS